MTGETRHTSPTGSVRPSSDQQKAAATTTAGQPRGSDSFMSQPNPDYVNYANSASVNYANSASTAGVVPPQQSPGVRNISFGYGHPPMQVANVQGEYISVRDSNGAGWSRHTVVYGGGGGNGGQGCAGCAAAGRRHGEGGSYGPNVTAEEKQRDAEVAASNKNAAAGPGGNA